MIESETSEPVIVIGQSMGAHTAMLLAAGRPDLVRALVMLEGDQGSGTVEEHRALGHFFRSWNVPFASRSEAAAELGDGPLERAWVEDLEETADGLVPRFDADVMQATIEAVGEPRWHEWESIDVPTLVVYADGGMFTECQKSAFVSQGRRVRRVDLSGASHDAHLDAHEQWAEALRTFIDAQ
ncbi:pimeloyl-ACP methyl ester carboxylesterase [Plantibacter flavus]